MPASEAGLERRLAERGAKSAGEVRRRTQPALTEHRVFGNGLTPR